MPPLTIGYIVKLISDKGIDYINIIDINNHHTLIHQAVLMNLVEIVKFLLMCKADFMKKGSDDTNALYSSVSLKNCPSRKPIGLDYPISVDILIQHANNALLGNIQYFLDNFYTLKPRLYSTWSNYLDLENLEKLNKKLKIIITNINFIFRLSRIRIPDNIIKFIRDEFIDIELYKQLYEHIKIKILDPGNPRSNT